MIGSVMLPPESGRGRYQLERDVFDLSRIGIPAQRVL